MLASIFRVFCILGELSQQGGGPRPGRLGGPLPPAEQQRRDTGGPRERAALPAAPAAATAAPAAEAARGTFGFFRLLQQQELAVAAAAASVAGAAERGCAAATAAAAATDSEKAHLGQCRAQRPSDCSSSKRSSSRCRLRIAALGSLLPALLQLPLRLLQDSSLTAAAAAAPAPPLQKPHLCRGAVERCLVAGASQSRRAGSMGQTACETTLSQQHQQQQQRQQQQREQMQQHAPVKEDLACASEIAGYLRCLREHPGTIEGMLLDCDSWRWRYRWARAFSGYLSLRKESTQKAI
ncbi:hypothetical protein Efla_006294 [Eimeria flavescens]